MITTKTNKIFVCEGLDRCGKSTFIDALRAVIPNNRIMVIHSGKPPAVVGIDLNSWSKHYYANIANQIRTLWNSGYDVILDRAWIGEYVYGQLYRGMEPQSWMFELETNILNAINPHTGWHSRALRPFDQVPDVRLITFIDSVANLINREDGNSLAGGKADLIGKEIELFTEAFEKSNIKNKILVNWAEYEFSKESIQHLITRITA